MAKAIRPRHTILGREAMLLLLTLAAASVDAISYLGLGQVFTAMMTGNTVLLGLALAQGEALAALRSILALIGFAIGVFAGAIIVERES
ncbi:MAG TPA: YoaK family protein, partial [Candidatus Binatia bacterium]|nr:YoaK family protein [Candidatus Binatia bacterium]